MTPSAYIVVKSGGRDAKQVDLIFWKNDSSLIKNGSHRDYKQKALYSELDDVFTLKKNKERKKQHHRFFLLENILLANCLWHDFI